LGAGSVEHVFAHQKVPMGLVVRTIGIAREKVKISIANLAYNTRRFVWLSGKYAAASAGGAARGGIRPNLAEKIGARPP
jgi:hypothetical protein